MITGVLYVIFGNDGGTEKWSTVDATFLKDLGDGTALVMAYPVPDFPSTNTGPYLVIATVSSSVPSDGENIYVAN